MGIFSVKKMFIIFSFVLLCGCSANYSIEIIDDNIVESADLSIDKSLINDTNVINSIEDDINYVYNNFHDIENGQEEEKTRNFNLVKIDDGVRIGLKYDNELSLEKYNNSPVLRQCFENVSVINTDSYVYIDTSRNFKCFDYYNYLEKITISLKTDYNINQANYDKKDNNIYYWYIDKNNYKDKYISISITKSKNNDFIENDSLVDILLLGIVVLFLIGALIIYIKVKKSNK